MTFRLLLTPANDRAVPTAYKMNLRVGITQQGAWVGRCLWVLMAMALLLLFVFYLWALLKKNRFHKHARLKNSYYVEDNPKEVQKNGKRLRKPGLGPWLNRWLNPFGDERTTTSFTRPQTGAMTFVASPSKNRVLMTESSFDAQRMTVPNYTPLPKGDRRREGPPISISAGTSIELKRLQGGTSIRKGHLKYVVEGQDDVGGFQIFCGVLVIISIIVIATLAILMLRAVN